MSHLVHAYGWSPCCVLEWKLFKVKTRNYSDRITLCGLASMCSSVFNCSYCLELSHAWGLLKSQSSANELHWHCNWVVKGKYRVLTIHQSCAICWVCLSRSWKDILPVLNEWRGMRQTITKSVTVYCQSILQPPPWRRLEPHEIHQCCNTILMRASPQCIDAPGV